MHKVAVATTVTLAIFILTTAGLAKVRDGGEFGKDWSTCVPSFVKVLYGSTCCLLLSKSHVHISYQMIPYVITDNHFIDGPVA